MSDSDFDVSLGENDMQEGPSAAIIPSSVGSAMVS